MSREIEIRDLEQGGTKITERPPSERVTMGKRLKITTTEQKLVALSRKWKRQENEFMREALKETGPRADRFAANRHEGEAIAFRWCREDLEKLFCIR